MKTIITLPKKNKRKIISIGQLEFSEDEIEKVSKLDFSIFIYSYQYESYSGSGFAAWKKGAKYFYHELGHCSCNGPLDHMGESSKVAITFRQLKKIVVKSYTEGHAKEVIANFGKLK